MQLQDFSSYFGHKSRGKWFTYNTVNFLSNFSAKMQLPASISLYTECWCAFIWVFSLEFKYKHQNQKTTRALFASPNSSTATFCLLKIHQQHKSFADDLQPSTTSYIQSQVKSSLFLKYILSDGQKIEYSVVCSAFLL